MAVKSLVKDLTVRNLLHMHKRRQKQRIRWFYQNTLWKVYRDFQAISSRDDLTRANF